MAQPTNLAITDVGRVRDPELDVQITCDVPLEICVAKDVAASIYTFIVTLVSRIAHMLHYIHMDWLKCSNCTRNTFSGLMMG